MSYKKYAFIVITIFSWCSLYSQNDFDSEYPVPLTQKSYLELNDLFYGIKDKDTLLAESYAEAFLKKAKSEGDTLKMAKGYKYFYFISKDSLALKYADSIIYITKEIDNKHYPALGYIYKGRILLYEMGKYEQALKEYLVANSYAIQHDNVEQKLNIKQAIGAIKNKWGEYKEALDIYKSHLQYIESQENYKEEYLQNYLTGIQNVSISYIYNKKYDSATYYTKIGIKESLRVGDSAKYYIFVLLEGTCLYDKGEYSASLDSINKAMPYIEGKDLAIGYLYLGKSHHKLNNPDETVYYLNKVDSIFQRTKSVYPELPDAYHILINHYKDKGDLKNQLIYLEKFLSADSIIKDNYIHLNKTINNKYDIPLLLAEKETIINKLENENFSNLKIIYILIAITFIFLVFIALYYNKQRKYKKRLKILLEQNNDDIREETLYPNENNELEIDVFIINTILAKLEKFENNQQYLQTNLSLASLSKEFGTNSAYLSKVINAYKNKNFANYLNDLRIDHAIKEIKTDTKLQSFTIKAIAEEMGFSTSQSFAKAFYKKTGIYPSYFIRELKKLKQQKN